MEVREKARYVSIGPGHQKTHLTASQKVGRVHEKERTSPKSGGEAGQGPKAKTMRRTNAAGQGLAIGRETEERVGQNLERGSTGVGRDPRTAARERKEIGHPRGHGLKEAVPEESGGGAAPRTGATRAEGPGPGRNPKTEKEPGQTQMTGVRAKAGRSLETEADPSQKIVNHLGPGPTREEPPKEKADQGPRIGKGAVQDLRTEKGADPILGTGSAVDLGLRTNEGRDPKTGPLGEADPETIPKTTGRTEAGRESAKKVPRKESARKIERDRETEGVGLVRVPLNPLRQPLLSRPLQLLGRTGGGPDLNPTTDDPHLLYAIS